ncbi:MAG: GH36-type glycosyl hydrolase domain-containing protein [Promethearchaeota archaeon]
MKENQIDYSYGSGYFGKWIKDQFGLPAYQYTCNQYEDPKAITPVNPKISKPNEHLFLVGNDRIAGVASNFGYIRVRQDEGNPKFLNDFYPEINQYGGGFGYLSDGKVILNTFHDEEKQNFERIYGVGYFLKKYSHADYDIDQYLFAPNGDDPLLISQVTITNKKTVPVEIEWHEYWGGFIYQLSFEGLMAAIREKDITAALKFRREKSKKLINEFFTCHNGQCLINIKHDSKLEIPDNCDDALNVIKNKRLKQKRPSFEDRYPPPIFLVLLNGAVDRIITDGNKFFGSGGIKNPDGIISIKENEMNAKGPESSLIMVRKLKLNPGEKKTLYFAYGYLSEDHDLDALISKYSHDFETLLERSCKKWMNNRITLNIPNIEWVDRELQWHYYYLRGSMTHDSFFMEHILSQGHVYQYIIGFQGAARDPLQHVLPFLLCDSHIVKEVIRYTLKEVQENGEIPYGITGNGMILPSPWKPSDLELWLLWVASEYVLSTRDTEFLNEEIPTYPVHGRKAGKSTVKEMLQLCYDHLTKITGTGKHGLQRLSNGDWNDMVVIGSYTPEQEAEIRKNAESMLNTAMAIKVLSYYAEMLNFIGEKGLSEEILEYASSLKKAFQEQWTGKWFKRAWLTDEIGWIGGEERMWLEPQPWAIISKSTDAEQTKILLSSINDLVRKPSKIGAFLHNTPIEQIKNPPGRGTNAGIWPSINGTLIWALSLVDGNLAWDEWQKNSLARHAEEYPEIWYGIWSGPDTFNSEFSKYPGQTLFDEYFLTKNPEDRSLSAELELGGLNWTDWPVLNLHPHAWPLFNTKHLVGIEFTKEGVEISPILSFEEFEYSTPLIGFKKSKTGYSGWYDPKREGTWKVSIKLPAEELNRFQTITINGTKHAITVEGYKIQFLGETKINEPLKWNIT